MTTTQIEAVYAAFGAALNGTAPVADYSFEKAARLAAAFYDLTDAATADACPASIAPTDIATIAPSR